MNSAALQDVYVFEETWSSYWKGGQEYAKVERGSAGSFADEIRGFEKSVQLDFRLIDGDTSDRTDYYPTWSFSSNALNHGNDDYDMLHYSTSPDSYGRGSVYFTVSGDNTIDHAGEVCIV